MSDPVEKRAGESLRPKGIGPLIEWQIAGDDDRATLISLAEDLKEQFGPGLRQRHESKLVDNKKFLPRQLFLESSKALLIPGFDKFKKPVMRRW